MPENEELKLGGAYTRDDIRSVYGGGPQGGICPAKKSNSVLIYSDPSRGEQYGYRDGWLPDDGAGPVFEYTGQGQEGHQRMALGNKSIRDQRKNGTPLRVFVARGGPRQRPQVFGYLGVFGLDEAKPYLERDAPDIRGDTRKVIVFRLRPVGDDYLLEDEDRLPPQKQTTVAKWYPIKPPEPSPQTSSRQVPTEKKSRTRSTRRATDEVEFEQREYELSRRFEEFLRSQGHEVYRYAIRVKGERGILYTDLCDVTERILYEAKGASGRDEIRHASSQLFDYRRHVEPRPRREAILLPGIPTEDLRDYIASLDLALVYEDDGRFVGWPVEGRR